MTARPDRLPLRLTGLAEARQLFGMIADAPVEIAVIAYLDDDLQLVGLERKAGTVDSVDIPPRDVAAGALRFGATQVVVAHNHPSGDATPSNGDTMIARRLARALGTIDVRLVDMLVLAGPSTTSLRAMQLL